MGAKAAGQKDLTRERDGMIQERLKKVESLLLHKGSGADLEKACIMQMVSRGRINLNAHVRF